MHEKWLTVAEVAREAEVHVETVRRWISHGNLQAAELGDRTGPQIARADLVRFMERRTALLIKTGLAETWRTQGRPLTLGRP